jgi:hypothetical protein
VPLRAPSATIKNRPVTSLIEDLHDLVASEINGSAAMSETRNELREGQAATTAYPGQPSQRRRRLIKGALSAPVFLTLQNGSVFANTSNDAEIAQTFVDVENITNPVCVVPGTQNFHEEGGKFDFGEGLDCSFTPGTGVGEFKINPNPNNQNPVICEIRENGGFKDGYIVAGSSGASICP